MQYDKNVTFFSRNIPIQFARQNNNEMANVNKFQENQFSKKYRHLWLQHLLRSKPTTEPFPNYHYSLPNEEMTKFEQLIKIPFNMQNTKSKWQLLIITTPCDIDGGEEL